MITQIAPSKNAKRAGVLMVAGAAIFWLANTVAEATYPSYSVRNDALSVLGQIGSPTQFLWNGALLVFSIAWLSAMYLLFKGSGRKGMMILNFIPGFGALIVSLFPGNFIGAVHILGAALAFLFGGVAAVADFKIVGSPFKYISLALGVVILVSLFMSLTGAYVTLGGGGSERLTVYPEIIWVISFGGFLMSTRSD